MRLLVQLVGIWIAKDIAAGRYPAKFAVPLSMMVARLGPPGIAAGALGMVLSAVFKRSAAAPGRSSAGGGSRSGKPRARRTRSRAAGNG